MTELRDAVLEGACQEELLRAPLPATYRAVHLRAQDVDMFEGAEERDVRKSLATGDVPLPEIAPDEVLIAVMAAAVNYNSVWSAMFLPMPTFRFLERYARQGGWAARHDQPYHVIGSDCSGVIVRVGCGVRRWRVGDHVVVHPVHVDDQNASAHDDAMMDSEQLAWGYETNFGAFGEYAVARASQLLAKPGHLTWEESAANTLCATTSYRMLVGSHGARMKQGDVVLVWGAAGGLGTYAVQLVKNGGGIPVAVVSSPEKAEAVRRLGCEHVIDRTELGLTGDPSDDPSAVRKTGKRLGDRIRELTGRAPDIVFEHTGRATFALSVFVVRRGGVVVTCGSSSGYQHLYDNRYLWMKLNRVIGSHGGNLQEATESTRLIESGAIAPALSRVYPFAEAGEAMFHVQSNEHVGKVVILCQAPATGLGVTDTALRGRLGARVAPLMREGAATFRARPVLPA